MRNSEPYKAVNPTRQNYRYMKRPNPQHIVDRWNAEHPIGTPVTRYKLINPLAEGNDTMTRSEAWVMGGHSAMVMVEGVSGGVMVESVVPLVLSDAAAKTKVRLLLPKISNLVLNGEKQ